MKIRTLFILLCISIPIGVIAQEKAKLSDKPVPKPTPEISLKLTPAETEDFSKIQTETNTIGNALNEALREQKSAVSDKDILAPAWKVSAIFTKLLDAQTRFQGWLTEAQKAHGCPNCGLDVKSLTFVKTEEKK